MFNTTEGGRLTGGVAVGGTGVRVKVAVGGTGVGVSVERLMTVGVADPSPMMTVLLLPSAIAACVGRPANVGVGDWNGARVTNTCVGVGDTSPMATVLLLLSVVLLAARVLSAKVGSGVREISPMMTVLLLPSAIAACVGRPATVGVGNWNGARVTNTCVGVGETSPRLIVLLLPSAMVVTARVGRLAIVGAGVDDAAMMITSVGTGGVPRTRVGRTGCPLPDETSPAGGGVDEGGTSVGGGGGGTSVGGGGGTSVGGGGGTSVGGGGGTSVGGGGTSVGGGAES